MGTKGISGLQSADPIPFLSPVFIVTPSGGVTITTLGELVRCDGLLRVESGVLVGIHPHTSYLKDSKNA